MEREQRTSISGAILSGGKCRRMGRDKAFCRFGEREMIRYSIDLLSPYCEDLMVIANREGYDDLGLRVISDIHTGSGPLGGIHTALVNARFEHVLVMACDMPLAHPAIVDRLIASLSTGKTVVPEHGGYLEPLMAIYHRSSLPEVLRRIHGSEFRLTGLLDAIGAQPVSMDDLLAGLGHDVFANINSPEDLQRYSP